MKSLIVIGISLTFLSCMKGKDITNTIDCSYGTTDSNPHVAELQPRGKCAFERDGCIYVSDSTLQRLRFSKKGLASIWTRQYGWLFVRRNGSTIPTVTFDNGPDYFVEHLARYIDSGKIGFIDESGNVTIKAEYEHAFPFDNNYAIVCNGCMEISDGEHVALTGGTWGCINKKGDIVLPIRYSQDEIRREVENLTVQFLP